MYKKIYTFRRFFNLYALLVRRPTAGRTTMIVVLVPMTMKKANEASSSTLPAGRVDDEGLASLPERCVEGTGAKRRSEETRKHIICLSLLVAALQLCRSAAAPCKHKMRATLLSSSSQEGGRRGEWRRQAEAGGDVSAGTTIAR